MGRVDPPHPPPAKGSAEPKERRGTFLARKRQVPGVLPRELAEAAARLESANFFWGAATADEAFELVLAHGRDRGAPYTVSELAGMVETGAGFRAPGSGALRLMKMISGRSEVRRRFGLPQHSCAEERSGCSCLSEAIDEFAAEGVAVTRRRVLALAGKHHVPVPPRRPEPWLESEPEPVPTPPGQIREVEPEVRGDPAELSTLVQLAAPEPEASPEEPPVRVVTRSRRWYDERPRFSDMKF
jgi:hypothetical protein